MEEKEYKCTYGDCKDRCALGDDMYCVVHGIAAAEDLRILKSILKEMHNIDFVCDCCRGTGIKQFGAYKGNPCPRGCKSL